VARQNTHQRRLCAKTKIQTFVRKQAPITALSLVSQLNAAKLVQSAMSKPILWSSSTLFGRRMNASTTTLTSSTAPMSKIYAMKSTCRNSVLKRAASAILKHQHLSLQLQLPNQNQKSQMMIYVARSTANMMMNTEK